MLLCYTFSSRKCQGWVSRPRVWALILSGSNQPCSSDPFWHSGEFSVWLLGGLWTLFVRQRFKKWQLSVACCCPLKDAHSLKADITHLRAPQIITLSHTRQVNNVLQSGVLSVLKVGATLAIKSAKKYSFPVQGVSCETALYCFQISHTKATF